MSIRTRRTRILGAVAAVLLIAGVGATVIAVRAQRSAPQPPPTAASPVNVIPSGTPGRFGQHRARSGRFHRPDGGTWQHPRPPADHPRADLGSVHPDPAADPGHRRGQRPEPNRAEPPRRDLDPAAGQGFSRLLAERLATPGQLGPSTIIGHVDSAAYGPGVFFKLGSLRQTDTIQITRSDGQVAAFEVERVVEYKKSEFPTDEVYGNIDHAGLRLITCGGDFDSSTRSYASNIVAYATLVSAHGA